MNNLMIIDRLWIGSFGIIKAEDKMTGEIKFYMGLGSGFSEEEDTRAIVNMGTKVDSKQLGSIQKFFSN